VNHFQFTRLRNYQEDHMYMSEEEYRHVRASMKAQIKANAVEARRLRDQAKTADGTPNKWGVSAKWSLKHQACNVGNDIYQPTRWLLLAYGFVRGLRYRQIEMFCRTDPGYGLIARICSRHGVTIPRSEIEKHVRSWLLLPEEIRKAS
jgi:hypothetical protein